MPLLEDLLITLLFGTQASFTHPGILIPTVESTGDAELKNVVKQTQRSRDARETLGNSAKVWRAMTETLRAGNDQLLTNKHHLLTKVWDLTILARNLLAAKEKAQNLAAAEGFEAEIRRLLSICVEKTSKPIPPNLDKIAHDKELQMKGGYKKVLITALQFLNNLMTGNETRKLHLWLHLFGTPSSVTTAAPVTNQNGSGGGSGSKNSKGKNKSKQSQAVTKASNNNSNNNNNINNNNNNNNNNADGSFAGAAIGTGVAPHSETAQKCNSLSAGFNAKYYKPGFLTDVPRLLQPDEIEPLLMILQSGVVCFEGADEAMQAVRCKLMLAQGYGRSLLRETLVFLGAWEVDEDDFCYRVLGQVVEAILLNGLIPYAYECFRDEKDIVTPAQSSLLKLLVSVYRPQPALPSPAHGEWGGQGPYPNAPFPFPFRSSLPLNAQHEYEEPPVIEASIPTFFVNVFRKQVLAPILSVIRLQGAIRRGEESKERFELSLWDLDRIYEGVYQFMELFVLFSEDEDAKRVLHGNNDSLICDFVKLLGELDRQIPRYVASKDKALTHRDKHEQTYQEQQTAGKDAAVADRVHKPAVESKFMVERPFDIDDTGDTEGDLGFDDADDDADPDRDLVDPDEFTWPNIKRFLVILISSLAWHNSNVQDIVRKNGGVEVVLNQCKIDDDNPYIREHAILCIRSLLQGNPANQKIVEELNARETVPSEVLDKHGYEPYIDEKGRVKLKRTGN